jgi:hypothetical protein
MVDIECMGANTSEVVKPESCEITEVKKLCNLKAVFLETQSVDSSVWPLKLMISNISGYWWLGCNL